MSHSSLMHDLTPETTDEPCLVIRPHLIERAARWFIDAFPGRVHYAIKANPDLYALEAIQRGGIRDFEVASQLELALARSLPTAGTLAFMHPVKSPHAIGEAYHTHGCRQFAIDHPGELDKIRHVLGPVPDLTLMVRMAVSNAGAALPLTRKFGATPEDTPALLHAASKAAQKIGLSFHIGSQNMRPEAFCDALATADRAITAAGLPMDILNIGGGFPEHYPGMTPPPWSAYIDAITSGVAQLSPLARKAQLWCEPGRALVAPGASVRTTVWLRKDNVLYINDGGFGALFDAVWAKWRFPARCLRNGGELTDIPLRDFTIYGPTCDSDDVLAHTLPLPACIQAGDEIEFGQLGAYGAVMANRFNGFGTHTRTSADDDPFPNALNQDAATATPPAQTARDHASGQPTEPAA